MRGWNGEGGGSAVVRSSVVERSSISTDDNTRFVSTSPRMSPRAFTRRTLHVVPFNDSMT